MADAAFSDPRLAQLYDVVEGERPDLEVYSGIVEELGARSILDIGCGTGELACRLARAGREVIGLDPAGPSLDAARRKKGAHRVRWIEGHAAALPPLQVDLVTMTGNVTQVFLTDEDWAAVLQAAFGALRPGGALVFETRDPSRRAWLGWHREETFRRLSVPGSGRVETWTNLTTVDLPFVSFRQTFAFDTGGAVLTSESTLRFRDRREIERSLQDAGFEIDEVRDAPDRPGLELVFICRRPSGPQSGLIRLTAGRTEVHRMGAVVVRAGGVWSRSVHALLRHLEARSFPGSPRVVGRGFDAAGNELLSYIEGGFVHPHAWSDEGIVGLGRLLRSLHDATAGFVPPADAVWQPWFTRSDSPATVFGHGDLGPWNIVAREGLPVGFIDWEFAGPVDRLDEVAQVAWLNAQLHDDDIAARNDLPPAEARARQLRLFVDAYGLDTEERSGLVTRMVEHAVRDAANELTDPGGPKMAQLPARPEDPGWAVAWRLRSAAWLVRQRPLLEAAILDPSFRSPCS